MKKLNLEKSPKDLEQFENTYSAGTFLFHQGFPAETFFIIQKGTVELVSEKNGRATVVNFIGAGNCLGERLLIETGIYPRAFGARALTDVKCIEIKKSILNTLHLSSPKSLIQLLGTSLQVCIQRLTRMNSLISQLKTLSSEERFLHLILFFYTNHARFVPQGKEVVLQEEMIRFYIEMSSLEIQTMLLDLEKRTIIHKTKDNTYLVKNEKSLRDLLSNVQEKNSSSLSWELIAA
ncbi:MAG: Crp/Fnr family transcriptional regulator [Pseudomonadota bacterium]